jgi:hypothetical protein
MIREVAKRVPKFRGDPSRTRCFAHIINLVVKSILKQFDAPSKQLNEELEKAERELESLAGDLDVEEALTAEELEYDEDEKDDDVDGLIDEEERLDEEDYARLRKTVIPVCTMLTKVCCRVTCDSSDAENFN